MELVNLTPEQLRKAADLQEQIQSLQQELRDVLGDVRLPAAGGRDSGKRILSSAGRAAISAAAKARWAKVRGEKQPASPTQKRGRKMSAAGRARLSAAARERWKKAKAAGKSRL